MYSQFQLLNYKIDQFCKMPNGFFYVSFSGERKCERIVSISFHEKPGVRSPWLKTQKLLTWFNNPCKKVNRSYKYQGTRWQEMMPLHVVLYMFLNLHE